MAANGSNVYVAWSEKNASLTFNQIFFTVSHDYGSTFSAPVQLSHTTTENAITPTIAASASNVYVSWTVSLETAKCCSGNGTFVISSNDNGSTWGPVIKMPGSHEENIAASGNNAYYIGCCGLFEYSHDGGKNWHFVAIGNPSKSVHEPWLATSGPYVYVVWETKPTNSTIYGQFSDDYGVSFGHVTLLSGSIRNDWEPQISAAGKMVYVAFHEQSHIGNVQVWMTVSNNNGTSWGTPVSLSGPGDNGFADHIAISGNYAFTIWGARVGVGPVWNAYVGYTTNNGMTWTAPPGIDVSNNTNGVAAPRTDTEDASVGAFGTHAFAAWEQNSTGIFQIWFSSS
jgi:photosystem II stability/assembly factor-like uncharacterized protein